MIFLNSKAGEHAHTAEAAPQARVFVGLNIAPEIANQLAEFAAALDKASVRPIAPADIHLTLVPPWNEISIPDAIEKLGRVAGRFSAFWLIIKHVGYGPQPRRPRLVWADCVATDEIAALRTALLETFGKIDEQPFQPHVTLARLRANGLAIARKYPIDQALSLTQRVESIELFRSPPPSGSGYQVIASLRSSNTESSAPIP
jgi:2'-5' RNA ligase